MSVVRHHPVAIALSALVCLTSPAVGAMAQQVEAPEHAEADRHHHRHHAEETGYLGISVRPLNNDLRRHFGAPSDSGVLVASVEGDAPAAEAGVAVGDVIVAVDRHMVGSVAGLHHEIRARAGERVEIEVYRDGEPLTLTATLGSRDPRHHHWGSDEWAEHWEEWGEGWAEWGEEWGEGWAEWGEAFGEHWAEFGAEIGERWAERGAEWGEIGAEIGRRMAEAFADMDWDEMDRAIEESMRALEKIDWDEIGDEIENALEEVDEALDEALEDLEDDDG